MSKKLPTTVTAMGINGAVVFISLFLPKFVLADNNVANMPAQSQTEMIFVSEKNPGHLNKSLDESSTFCVRLLNFAANTKDKKLKQAAYSFAKKSSSEYSEYVVSFHKFQNDNWPTDKEGNRLLMPKDKAFLRAHEIGKAQMTNADKITYLSKEAEFFSGIVANFLETQNKNTKLPELRITP